MSSELTISEAGRRWKVPLKAEGTTIGRGEDCDVVLDHRSVSRHHARFSRDPLGQWTVEDLGSHNGVLVGGAEVRMQAIWPGEEVTIGSFVLKIEETESVEPTPARTDAKEGRVPAVPIEPAVPGGGSHSGTLCAGVNTTFGMSPQNLAALWGLGMEEEDAKEPTDQEVGQLLRGRLAGKPPVDRGDTLQSSAGPQGGKPASRRNKSLGEILLDPRTDLDTIQTIKEYGKVQSVKRRSAAEQAVGVTIYYAAIASAILFRDAKITQNTYADLVQSLGLLLDKPWMPPEMLRHLEAACERCRRDASH